MGTTSLEDLKSVGLYRAGLAELIGTLLLVFVGCGACTSPTTPSTVVQIALAFGLSVATIVWSIAHISGGHINPAVTFGFLAARRISVLRAILYVVCQLVGAIAGAGLLSALLPADYHGGFGQTDIDKLVSRGQGFGIEFFVTFVLVFTVFATCDGGRTDMKGSGPLAIGLSVTMCHLFAIYWVGPILGGIVAALIYEFLFSQNSSKSKLTGYFSRGYDPEAGLRDNEDSGDPAELKPLSQH